VILCDSEPEARGIVLYFRQIFGAESWGEVTGGVLSKGFFSKRNPGTEIRGVLEDSPRSSPDNPTTGTPKSRFGSRRIGIRVVVVRIAGIFFMFMQNPLSLHAE
jgi:hypothetical protein